MNEVDSRDRKGDAAHPLDELERGRECCRRRAWLGGYEALSLADQATPLEPEDLELLAVAAYLAGRDDDYLSTLERAHQGHLVAGEDVRAARCAFWLGFRLLFRGESGRASGWLQRAQRLLESVGHDCVERGYLLLPRVQQQLGAGDGSAAFATAAQAAAIGERFGDADLVACARHLQGFGLMEQGQVEPGLMLLDEAMIAVTAGELSPIFTGLIYCSVIEACQSVYALSRAREWTAALTHWCAAQPELVSFSGVCQVHRAEIMQLQGAWPQALEEAQRAVERCGRAGNAPAMAAAFYQQAEVHRLRGEFTAAEEAYRGASQTGREPQPGLALLRLAQGRTAAAAVAISRVLGATTEHRGRAGLLPACVEVLLAAGDVEQARGACLELQQVAHDLGTSVTDAMAAQARGSVQLAEGDARAALKSLRRASAIWEQVEAPYPAACARALAGLACRTLGDDEGCRLDLEAARRVFDRLGAAPDRTRIDLWLRGSLADSHGLTRRELQVLRLVATGKTNKVIANELFLSEKTIDRHVSNIFDKLGVASRSAATAYACKHNLA